MNQVNGVQIERVVLKFKFSVSVARFSTLQALVAFFGFALTWQLR
jgi:hypothetical protein